MFLILIFAFSISSFSNALPLTRRLVDLTYVLDENNHRYIGMKKFKIDDVKYWNYYDEAFGQETSGVRGQVEEYSSGTHVGTHMDAPSHFIKGGMNVDQIPIEKFFAPAAVIDITSKAVLDPDAEASVEDLQRWESGTGHNLNGTIILVRSGWGSKWNNREAYYGTPEDDMTKLHFPGFAPEASQWLVDNRSIKGIGIDTISLDNGQSKDFRSHLILLGNGIFILENVANVDKLPLYGAKLFVFPMKLGKGSGAPTRIVASVPKIIN